jgi:hypothetical protein
MYVMEREREREGVRDERGRREKREIRGKQGDIN